MVGNSLKSDVLPVLALGGYGVHVPGSLLWAHEHVEDVPKHHERFFTLDHIGELPALIRRLTKAT
jgi:putative hydrolase of the HAD superfamily